MYRPWTDKEVKFVMENYKQQGSNEWIAEKLDRTLISVQQKYFVMNNPHKIKKQQPKKKIYKNLNDLESCPHCGAISRWNKIENGYYCLECLREFDRRGEVVEWIY